MNSQSTRLRFPSVILEFQAYAIIFKNPSTMFLRMPCGPGFLSFMIHPTTLLIYSSPPGGYMNLMRTKPVFKDCSVTG